MSKRKRCNPDFKEKVTLEALKGKQTVAELSIRFSVHPTMIHPWKKAILEGAPGVFEHGSAAKDPTLTRQSCIALAEPCRASTRQRQAYARNIAALVGATVVILRSGRKDSHLSRRNRPR